MWGQSLMTTTWLQDDSSETSVVDIQMNLSVTWYNGVTKTVAIYLFCILYRDISHNLIHSWVDGRPKTTWKTCPIGYQVSSLAVTDNVQNVSVFVE